MHHVAIPFSALWLNLNAETTKKNQLSEIKYGKSKAESWNQQANSAFRNQIAVAGQNLKAEISKQIQLSEIQMAY